MNDHTIEVEITVVNGLPVIKTETKGVFGPSCEELTAWLATLGEEIEHGRTPDFSRGQAVGARTSQRTRVGQR